MEMALFYIFSLGGILFALFTTLLNNNVHKILCLVGLFFFSACLAITMNFEFIATMLIVVYMGAIAMLFIFVVMLIGQQNEKPIKFSIVNFFLSMALGCSIFNILYYWQNNLAGISQDFSIAQLGFYIYHNSSMQFLWIGVILFLGLMSAILLTIQYKKPNKFSLISKKYTKTKLLDLNINSGIEI